MVQHFESPSCLDPSEKADFAFRISSSSISLINRHPCLSYFMRDWTIESASRTYIRDRRSSKVARGNMEYALLWVIKFMTQASHMSRDV